MCNIEKEHIFGCLGVIIVALVINYLFIRCVKYITSNIVNTTPVEEIQTIDSLKKSNKTLIIEVEHLDSIKNEKVIKVKELDNDSTLKLFYQLISE